MALLRRHVQGIPFLQEEVQANYHQATPQRELAQMFKENCLPDKIAIRVNKAEDMLTAWRILDAIYDNLWRSSRT
jgi:hypothetical protein